MTFYEPYPRRITPTSSRSSRAATHLKEHGGSFAAAGRKFGIQPEAVRQAWYALGYGGEDQQSSPAHEAQERTRARVLELLAAQQLTATEIEAQTGLVRSAIYKLAKDHGLTIFKRKRKLEGRADVDAVIQQVMARAITIATGAQQLGVPYTALHAEIQRRGLKVSRKRLTCPPKIGPGPSKSELAADLVETKGMTYAEAGGVVGVSPAAVGAFHRPLLRRRVA